jgi:hypothetical protein
VVAVLVVVVARCAVVARPRGHATLRRGSATCVCVCLLVVVDCECECECSVLVAIGVCVPPCAAAVRQCAQCIRDLF